MESTLFVVDLKINKSNFYIDSVRHATIVPTTKEGG